MEAVIAANVDNPEINGMRLALANRYFEEGAYQSAFVHFEAVLDSDPDATEAAVAYTRLGWMVYDGNGETELGLDLIERGLELVPEDAFALYLKGRIVWCGLAQPAEASSIFEQVLTTAGLDPNVTEQVEADLAAASAGEECSSHEGGTLGSLAPGGRVGCPGRDLLHPIRPRSRTSSRPRCSASPPRVWPLPLLDGSGTFDPRPSKGRWWW